VTRVYNPVVINNQLVYWLILQVYLVNFMMSATTILRNERILPLTCVSKSANFFHSLLIEFQQNSTMLDLFIASDYQVLNRLV
jgi:hypothetical protein